MSFFIAVILSTITLQAQSTTVLLKGIITDTKTGKPVGTNYEITDQSGNKVADAKSNPRTGEYSSALKPGASYSIFFYGFDILKSTKQFTLQPASQYQEIEMNFSVDKLESGMELYSLSAFQNGSNELTAEAKAAIEDTKAILKGNRNLHIEITILPDMAAPRYEQPAAPKVDKKKKKGSEPPPQPILLNPTERIALNPAVQTQRADAVKALFGDAKVQLGRVNFVIDQSKDAAQDLKKSTLIISVGQVKSLFD